MTYSGKHGIQLHGVREEIRKLRYKERTKSSGRVLQSILYRVTVALYEDGQKSTFRHIWCALFVLWAPTKTSINKSDMREIIRSCQWRRADERQGSGRRTAGRPNFCPSADRVEKFVLAQNRRCG